MKSTLKIDELEIILEGVDDQWLKHNHRYIVEAIIAAFEPFDHREFNENVINELVIELPKSHSFNQFLDDLLHKLRSEIVDKNVIRKGQNETSAIAKPISNWQTIENLFDRLKNQSSSNSNLYQKTLNEILTLVKTNEQLIWEFIAKLGLPKQFLEKFKSWILVEKIHPNLIVLWMGSFIEIQKKNQNESPDVILLKIIFQSVYNQNQQGLTIANLQNTFVQQLLKIPNQSIEETVEYQSSIGDINNIFSSYFNEYDVIKNLINIDFIEKIIQLNTTNQSLSKSKQKIEILMFFAALKIANSLNITQYEQLIETLNQAYAQSNKGQFNEQFILQIFKQYLPTNQHNILASLFEMTVQETKLFNLNNDIETSIVQLFTKIERFILDNHKEINENIIPEKENTNIDNFKLTQKYIIEQIIQFNFFKTWPEEIDFLKPILQQYFTILLTNKNNTFELNQLPFPISATGEIAFKELAIILNKILEIKSKNPTQFQNLLFEYSTVINLLILNLLDFQQPKFSEPSIENKDNNVSKSFKKDTKDKFKNLKKLNENISKVWPNFKDIFNHYELKSSFSKELSRIANQQKPTDVFNFLSLQISQSFAESFFEILWQISDSQSNSNRYILIGSFLNWVELNFEHYKANKTTIAFNEYFGKSPGNESQFENKIQQVKETLSKEIIANIEQLKIQNTSEIELEIFTNQELKLWESFIDLIEANEINAHKLREQLSNFESAFQIISEFWLTQQNMNQPNELKNKFTHLKSLGEILEIKLNAISTLKSSFNQEILNLLNHFKQNSNIVFLIYQLKYNQIYETHKERLIKTQLDDDIIKKSGSHDLQESEILISYIIQFVNQSNETQISFLDQNQKELIQSNYDLFTKELSNNFNSVSKILASQIYKFPITLKLFSYVESLEQRKKDISNSILMDQIDGIQSIVLLESIKVILFDLLNQFILNRANHIPFKIALSNLPKSDFSATINSLVAEINEIDLAIKLIRDSIQFEAPKKYKELNLNREELKKVSELNLTLNEKGTLVSILNLQISDIIENTTESKSIPIVWDEFKIIDKSTNESPSDFPQILGDLENIFQQELESNVSKAKHIELQTAVELNQINELIQFQNNALNRDMIESLNHIDQQLNDIEIIKKWNLQDGINLKNKNVIPILIGEIILKIRAPWFNYLNKFAITNEQLNLISKQLNWFNQLIEQNIVLNIQPAQNELIQKYIREIETSNLQKYELKEHLYIQTIFNLILQFIEQNDRIKTEITQILSNEFVKNIAKVAAIFQSALEIHNEVLSVVIIQNYARRSEIDIATESKNIIQKIFHSPINETSEWTPKNVWFQTENNIPIASIFNDNEIWRILFYEKSDAIYVQNESNVITPIWKQSEHLKMLLKHPDSKKWMVELSKNKGEGFMDLASTLSMDAIFEAHQGKYKAPNQITLNIQSLLVELKTILSDNAILEFYQFSKFQILQTQSPLSKIFLSQIYYLSYLSVSSKKTIPEISQFAKLIFEKLELNSNEKGIIQKFINEKLPTESSIENIGNNRITVEAINSQKQSNELDSKSAIPIEINIDNVQHFTMSNHTKEYLIQHLLKYPSISETELIDQIQLLLNYTLKPEQTSFLLKVISVEIWQQLNRVIKEKSTHKQESQFLNKVVSNWLRFKLLHFTIKYAYSNVEQWIVESKQILHTVNVSKIDAVHFNWLLFDEKIKSEISEIATNASLFYQFTPENIENIILQNKNASIEKGNLQQPSKQFNQNEKALERELPQKDTEGYRTDPIKMIEIENEVFTELIQWQEEINSRIKIPQKKAIENQQNKDEYHLELPIQSRGPNIMDWEQLNTSENIINSIITILLKEGIQLKTQEKYNEEFIRINQFLSSKAFYRILGNSSVPLQFIGLFYEQFFGYSMGLIDEDWKGFVQPKKSQSLVEKLRLIREEENMSSKNDSWFEKLLNFSEYEEGKPILGVNDFNLILREIQNLIQQKLSATKFNKAHESLKENWIQHLIFFKMLQFKSNPDSIGSFYAILESDQTQIDKWIHQISDHILFDIHVEYDFWIANLSRFGNYFEESNIIALFQLSESLKLVNSEIKLSIEDILEETLRMSENRPFDVAISNVFIPKLVPLFYENHLSKTTQFRELNLLSLILSERNTISSRPQEISKDETITLDEIFKEFNSEETLTIDPEILKEISLIIGKNLDETSRWILHELAQSNANKLNEFAQKIHETHQVEVKIKTYYQSIINNPKLSSTIQDLISPIIINLKETKKSDSKIKSEIDNGTRFVTTLCGLMMLSPFLATLFRRMGLLEKNEFVSEKEQLKAYKVLMTIPKIDEEQVYEYQDLIPRIITGIAPEDTINYVPELTEEELTEIRNFLGAVISQWPVMANATVRGFIESFLVRDGKVWKEGSLWKIEVNGHGADIILQTLTWGFSTMKFPWTPYMIETNWLSP